MPPERPDGAGPHSAVPADARAEANIDAAPPSARRTRASVAAPRPPSFAATEVFGREALRRIAKSLPLFERAYAEIRFSILRPKLLSVMDLLLPDEGRILDVGCGFGLFAAYFGQTHPGRSIVGVDPNARRVKLARHVASELGLDGHSFEVGDVRQARLEGPFAGAYVLDVMHHIPAAEQEPTLARMADLLAPGGVLLIKDITTEPLHGLLFTEALDRLMVGLNEPLAYRHHGAWGEMLTRLGFKVRIVRVPDVLPYPHVVIAATKA
ncbi:MAG: class I SAM-dependent methyltransferase [Myxococcales bacterium]|nr:class I SAM-dependent methyltransferase [Myxococcales bacterium]